MNYVEIHGARLHNLKNINLRIPKDQLVVVTGVSGSGKSSLVFDLLFAEGRKRYLESQGALPTIEIEDPFDYIEGLQPTVAVQQRLIRESNPRSVVGTKTRILNILNLVYAADAVDASGAKAELPASYFSFNSALGICFECSGRGYVIECDVDALIPDHSATLAQIQTRVCQFGEKDWQWQGSLAAFTRYWDVTVDTPFASLSAQVTESYIHGMDRRPEGPRWVGVVPFLREQKFKGRGRGRAIFRATCSQCAGDRIGELGRSATIAGKRFGQLAQMNIAELAVFLHEVRDLLSPFSRNSIAVILGKIDHLINVGLSYLKLYREMPSLSGGEIQRLFLMSHLDAEMEALIYVFDEPTAGLHESEKQRLIDRLGTVIK